MPTLLQFFVLINIGIALMDFGNGDIFRALFDLICAFVMWSSLPDRKKVISEDDKQLLHKEVERFLRDR